MGKKESHIFCTCSHWLIYKWERSPNPSGRAFLLQWEVGPLAILSKDCLEILFYLVLSVFLVFEFVHEVLEVGTGMIVGVLLTQGLQDVLDACHVFPNLI